MLLFINIIIIIIFALVIDLSPDDQRVRTFLQCLAIWLVLNKDFISDMILKSPKIEKSESPWLENDKANICLRFIGRSNKQYHFSDFEFPNKNISPDFCYDHQNDSKILIDDLEFKIKDSEVKRFTFKIALQHRRKYKWFVRLRFKIQNRNRWKTIFIKKLREV